MPLEHNRPWAAPAEELVLYRAEGVWRFAVQNEAGILDGRLEQDDRLEAAQNEVLRRIEEMTDRRYTTSWRAVRPDWWAATLDIVDDPGPIN